MKIFYWNWTVGDVLNVRNTKYELHKIYTKYSEMWKAIKFFAKKVTTSITIDWFIVNIVEWITLNFILLSIETRNGKCETREWVHCCEKMLKFIFVIKLYFHLASGEQCTFSFMMALKSNQSWFNIPFPLKTCPYKWMRCPCSYCQNQFITINNRT